MATKKAVKAKPKAKAAAAAKPEPAERRIFSSRVIDKGNGTGTFEVQLDGSLIFRVEGLIDKEAFHQAPQAPESAGDEGEGANG